MCGTISEACKKAALSKPISTNYLTEWRSYIETNPYGSIHDWYDVVGVGNKQGAIGVEEANDMVSKIMDQDAKLEWLHGMANKGVAANFLGDDLRSQYLKVMRRR